jgi:hypothetical protein
MCSISRFERFSVLLKEPSTLSFPCSIAPTIAGTIGDYLITLYSHIMIIHYNERVN